MQPTIVIMAGPNGAGKSTLAPGILRGFFSVEHFVNADIIAQGLSNYAPEAVAMEAGRLMLHRLDELAAARASFAFESTLSSRTFAPWLRKRKAEGYLVAIFFICLPSADQHIQRVAARVQSGGHYVDDETVRRRYDRAISNFLQLYRPLADYWTVIHNATDQPPNAIAAGFGNSEPSVQQPALWLNFGDNKT